MAHARNVGGPPTNPQREGRLSAVDCAYFLGTQVALFRVAFAAVDKRFDSNARGNAGATSCAQ
jgi:hypothetical protein